MSDHSSLAGLAYRSRRKDAAFGAVEFESVFAAVVLNAKESVHAAYRAIFELKRSHSAVFASITMDSVIDEARNAFDRPEEHFQQINAMAAHINERSAATQRRVLPEPFWHRRIPA